MSVILYQATLRNSMTSLASKAIDFQNIMDECLHKGAIIIFCKSSESYNYINGMQLLDHDKSIILRGAGSIDVATTILNVCPIREHLGGVFIDEALKEEVNSMFDFS